MNIVSPANSGTTLDQDAGIVPGLAKGPDGLPQTIVNYLQGQTINVAMTDVRPEDAKFATIRALTGYGLRIPRYLHTGLGYSTGAPPSNPLGNPVYSAYSGAQANVVDYVIVSTDTDPFTLKTGARSYSVVNIGAAPVVVIYNYTNSQAGHLGDGNYTNINHMSLYNALAGNYTHIRQLSHTATVSFGGTINEPEASMPLHTWQREPISGTFNTMEYDICLTRTIYPTYEGPGTYGQETGVNPTANLTACNPSTYTTWPCNAESGNPFFHIDADGGTRGRAVGTGDMINAVYNTPDSLGYAFWGFSNFYNKQSNIMYMTVDGVDPLYSAPSGGTLPQCTGSAGVPPCPTLSFPHIVDGTYPIWSMYRAVYDPTVSNLVINALVNYAQHAVVSSTGFSDFVPAPSMTVFRSHYNQVVVTSNSNDQVPNNGFFAAGTGPIESGGDMGGAILTIQSELDYITDTAGQNGCPAAPLGCQQTNMFQ
jgi:hypothetical protein